MGDVAVSVNNAKELSTRRVQQTKSKRSYYLKRYRFMYLMLLPALAFYATFSYYPMYGITLAFKQYMFNLGVLRSPWVGLANFQLMFQDPQFWNAFRNTIEISLGRLAFEFPVAIILALLLNELGRSKMKRVYQTVLTFPHFLSWVVFSGIMIEILGDTGIVDGILSQFGIHGFDPLVTPSVFRPLLFITDNLKEVGWGTIIYLAAIAGVNPELYEAAYVDGAGRLRQMWHVTLPGIRGTISILLIFAVGGLMNAGFDQIFNMYSGPVQPVSDILQTYVFRLAFVSGNGFDIPTAAGLFSSVIGGLLLLGANWVIKRMGQEGLF